MFQTVYATETIEIPGIRAAKPAGASDDTEWTYLATDVPSLNALFARHSRATIQAALDGCKKSVKDSQVNVNGNKSLLRMYNNPAIVTLDGGVPPEDIARAEARQVKYEAELVYFKGATSVFEALLQRRTEEDWLFKATLDEFKLMEPGQEAEQRAHVANCILNYRLGDPVYSYAIRAFTQMVMERRQDREADAEYAREAADAEAVPAVDAERAKRV